MRKLLEEPGNVHITDLHVWRVGPEPHAAIVSVLGIDAEVARDRLRPVHEIAHLTVEAR